MRKTWARSWVASFTPCSPRPRTFWRAAVTPPTPDRGSTVDGHGATGRELKDLSRHSLGRLILLAYEQGLRSTNRCPERAIPLPSSGRELQATTNRMIWSPVNRRAVRTAGSTLRTGAPVRSSTKSRAAREQAFVTSGQLFSGLGSLLFALILARLLSPSSFAQVASFLSLFLLLSMPGASITAAVVMAPTRTASIRRLMAWLGVVAGVVLAGWIAVDWPSASATNWARDPARSLRTVIGSRSPGAGTTVWVP